MPKTCGIYKITSPSCKIYIGQSVYIEKRWRTYKNPKNNNGQTKLENSLRKYGFEAHTVEILHVCPSSELNSWEKHFIDVYNTFNTEIGMNLKSGGHFGGTLSEESKIKLRKPKSLETKEKYRQAAINRAPVSMETREKHRQRMLGNTHLKGHKPWQGKRHTEATKNIIREKRKNQIMPKGYRRILSIEHKLNLSLAHKNKPARNRKVVYSKDVKGNILQFPYLKQCAEELNVSRAYITEGTRTGKLCKGFYFSFNDFSK